MSTNFQKCVGKGPTDYWGLLLSESLIANEPRDQPVLRAIQGGNNGTTPLEQIAQHLFESEDFGKRFEHFGSAFEATKLPSLASELYAIIRRQMGRNFQRDGVPGFFCAVAFDGHEQCSPARSLSLR